MLLALLAVVASAAQPFDHSHAAWTAVLRGYVRDGAVDYAGLKARGEPQLTSYLRALETLPREEYEHFSREQRLAFWINAYNAYTVRLTLDHYPLKSIRSIGLLPLAAFRKSFIPLLGQELSLNDIENDRLRAELRDPRIHFAIVCASKSCPALRSEAWRADAIDQQLDEATVAFLRDTSRNRWDAPGRTLLLSSIFKWFREDFERAAGSLLAFVARYARPEVAAVLQQGPVKIEFLDYDWSLNAR